MKISVINTGYFKLDGGAMFGVVPKKMWEKLNPPDANNLCTWAMRCLLVETGNRKILIDTGIGEKQDAKFRSHFEPTELNLLLENIKNLGLSPADITDVFLTHLHFDHCGGALMFQTTDNSDDIIPTFPNATYWSNQQHWDWAMQPNPREMASFLKENFEPLQKRNILEFVNVEENFELFPNFNVYFSYGHTEAMMMVKLTIGEKTLFYCADTIPSSWHIHMPYVMAYDVRPLETLKEKKYLLERAVTEGWYLFFEHDPIIECATVKKDEKGRIVIDKTYTVESIFRNEK